MSWCTAAYKTFFEFYLTMFKIAAIAFFREWGRMGVALFDELEPQFGIDIFDIDVAVDYYCEKLCGHLPPQSPPPKDVPTPAADRGSSQPVGSFDRNDKLAPAGYSNAHFVLSDSILSYQVRFENKSDATAPAQKIVVTDTLDDGLDLNTFELTEIAFGGQTIIIPPGLDHYETSLDITIDNEFASGVSLRVQIDVALDINTPQLTFSMIALDPATGWLPQDVMVGLLYPNDQTGRGDGHISYTINPFFGLTSGTEITNKATIIFDYNDPIDTPLVLNTLDAGTPSSNVLPLPARIEETEFLVQWTGQDDEGGSGIASYDIYVSTGGEPYILWLDDTTDSSATYTGEFGNTYAFYSIA